MYLVICNNTKENFSWESEKMNVKLWKHSQVNFWKFHVNDVILWKLTFTFSGSHKKFSLVLLQMTKDIFSPLKM